MTTSRTLDETLDALEDAHSTLVDNSEYIDSAVLDEHVRALEVIAQAAADKGDAAEDTECLDCGCDPCECNTDEDEDYNEEA